MEERVAIVVAERGPRGVRLVAIDEAGDRQFVAVAEPPAGVIARDTHPAISPDGRWIVFASSRERSLAETSLWLAPLGIEQRPVRLTRSAAIDAHPAWSADGRSIVYASAAPGGTYDLYRLAIANGRATGSPTQLTDTPGHEVTPAIARDGTIVYTAITGDGRELHSRIEERAPDGTIRAVTGGPADSAPALSPDGRVLAFARPLLTGDRASGELWLLPYGATDAEALTSLPLTEEGGPVWSRDGRFVFATSVLGGESGALFSSVIHVDVSESTRRVRVLVDRAGAAPRLTPAVTATSLDAQALHADPEYVSELARVMARLIEERRERAEQDPP